MLLFGEYPNSSAKDEKNCTQNSSNGSDVTMSDNESGECSNKDWIGNGVSDLCLELLESLLEISPRKRPTIESILKHPWMSQDVDESMIEMVYLEMSERTKFMKNPKDQKILPFEEEDEF